MVVLHPGSTPTAFFAHVSRAPTSVLLLDYDGTLAPFHVRPQEALPYAGVQERLRDIQRGGLTRVIFVTGRSIADFLPLVSMDPLPEIWGSHGWERRFPDGHYECPALAPALKEILLRATKIGQELPEGAHWEHKPYSVAVHWRGAEPDIAQCVENKIRQHWTTLVAGRGDAAVAGFDGGIELRIAGRTKADAVRTVVEESGREAPVAFLGDDLTDEDAFQALPAGGLGVLVRSELRPTAAGLWLQPPGELLWFLEQWNAALTGAAVPLGKTEEKN